MRENLASVIKFSCHAVVLAAASDLFGQIFEENDPSKVT